MTQMPVKILENAAEFGVYLRNLYHPRSICDQSVIGCFFVAISPKRRDEKETNPKRGLATH
jgi:hypothetical protein